ncbi:MAG TPA: hypothetical protein VIF09_10675, partial [Polyangiaceae bacterium]
MTFKPWLPLHAADVWELGFILNDGVPISSIEARGGLVVACGADVHELRPGAAVWGVHGVPPYDLGSLRLAAVEPRGAKRYAVASAHMVTMFERGEGPGEVRGFSSSSASLEVTHLAWAGTAGPSALWVLRDDHVLYQMRDDGSGLVAMESEPLHAIASDERGVFAMLSLSAGPPRVLLSPDGSRWDLRPLDAEVDLGASVQLAVAGTAVALLVDGKYVLLSRTIDEPFARVPAADLGEDDHGWRMRAIAFQGSSSDSALFYARSEDDLARIVRV